MMTHDGRHARGTRAEIDTAGLGLALGQLRIAELAYGLGADFS